MIESDVYKKFFKFLKQINHPVLFNLNKGLSVTEIIDLESKFNKKLPNYIKDLYHLYNGTNVNDKTIGELLMFPNGIFLSLEDGLEIYEWNTNNHYWEDTNFPLFTSGGGDYLFVQLNSGENNGRIYFYSPSNVDFDGIISMYDNLTQMLESIIKCYENNVYYIKDNSLEWISDPIQEAKISKELNPKSDYWKIFDNI
jgi:cell wall assembly regulator SMI1